MTSLLRRLARTLRGHAREALAVLAVVAGVAGGGGLYVGLDGYYLRVTASIPVSGIAPASGPAVGGTPVTITGSGFTSAAKVKFGSVPAARVTFVSGNEIIAVSPPGAGTVEVIVTVGSVSSGRTAEDLFGYAQAVSRISPTYGSVVGGTLVTITGSGFAPGATVDFGAAPATSVRVVSPTEIIAVSPASSAAGPVIVIVSVGAVTSAASGADQFTYFAGSSPVPVIAEISPTGGPATGGTVVQIIGSGFAVGATVYFGSTQAELVDVISSNEIVVSSPPGTAGHTVYITVAVGRLPPSVPTRFGLFTYI
jgi:hypothetical protein